MTALAAATNSPQLGMTPILPHRDEKCAASQTFYNGAMVGLNASGHLVPAANTVGLRVVGWADLNRDVFVSSSVAGGDTIRVAQGVKRFANSADADLIAQVDVDKLCYVVDDQTVAKLGTGNRPVAGRIVAVDSTGVYVQVIGQTRGAAGSDQTYVAPTTVTTGAIPVTSAHSNLSVTGTIPFTLADGVFPGQRKSLRCTVAATSPAGTLTPATPTGFATILFDAVGEFAELEWNGSAWVLVFASGATVS